MAGISRAKVRKSAELSNRASALQPSDEGAAADLLINGSVDYWRSAPAPGAGEDDWSDYKKRTYENLIDVIRTVDRQLGGRPYLRLEQLRRLRREHHLLVVADRIRRETTSERNLSLKELRTSAERIVDRGARLGATGTDESRTLTQADERMMISARVHWHKLLRKAGSRAELRGTWGGRSQHSGIKTIVERIVGRRANPRAQQALRDYIRDRLEQLLAVANEVQARSEFYPSRMDRLLVRELELLLHRARMTALQASDSKPGRNHRGA
jgi:hypothetical protein